jgi:hypothetical protein
MSIIVDAAKEDSTAHAMSPVLVQLLTVYLRVCVREGA